MNKRSFFLTMALICTMQISAQIKESEFRVDRTKFKDFIPSSRIEKIDLGAPGAFAKHGMRMATKRPDHVYNNQTKYFPPAFNQDGGSCGSASAVSYLFTYELNAYRDLDGSLPENQYPSHFTWLTSYQDVDKDDIMKGIGVPNAVTYNGRTYSRTFAKGSNVDCDDLDYGWMQGYDRWYSAMFNKLDKFVMLARDLRDPIGREQLKNWLWNHNGDTSFKSGGCATMGCAITGFKSTRTTATANNVANGLNGKYFLTSWGPTFDHGTTIVGYDDRVECDVNGDGIIQEDEVGAWIMENSWGANWQNGGWFYIPYKIPYSVMDNQAPTTVGLWFIRKDYKPLRTVRMKMDYNRRSEIYIHAGVSENLDATKPDYEIDFEHFKYMSNQNNVTPAPLVPMLGRWADGMHYEPMEFGYDLTDLTDCVDKSKPLKYFFYVKTKSGAIGNGNVYDCTLIDYEDNADGNMISSGLTDDAPMAIQNNGEEICITIVTSGSKMKAPRNLTLQDNNSISWTSPLTILPVSKYNIYCNDELEASVSNGVRKYTITNLHAAYNVRAVYNVDGEEKESVLSNTVSAEVNENTLDATFTGEISGSYMRYIRNLVKNHSLVRINMKDATIVGRGEPYYMQYRTKDNIFPAYAFNQMTKLRSIVLPENIEEIGEYAFNECTGIRTSVEIPASVKIINPFAFCKCERIPSVKFNEGLEYVGKSGFDMCKGLKELVFPDSFYGADDSAFGSCSWTKVVFGTGYRRAGWCTFYGNVTRTEVYLPTTVLPTRGDYTFDWNGANIHVRADMLDKFLASEEWTRDNKYTFIGDIVIPEKPANMSISSNVLTWNSVDGIIRGYNVYCNGTKVATVDQNTTSFNLDGCHGLYHVTAIGLYGESECSDYISPDVNKESVSATIIGDVNNTYLGYIREMVENYKLQHIDMSDANLVSGGENYFHNYSIVKNQMPREAFAQCKNLVTLKLPYNLTCTNFDSFAYCDNLKEVYFGPNIAVISQGCCHATNKRLNVYLPVTKVPSGARYMFSWNGADIHVLPGMAEKFRAANYWSGEDGSKAYTYIEDYGDINGDARVTAADVSLLIEILNGRASDNGKANTDRKNGVTIDDVNALLKIINEER